MTHYWQVVAEFQNAETIVLSNFQFHSGAMELVQAITKNNVGWYRKTDNESVNLSQAIRVRIIRTAVKEVAE
ncbi:hypothetical protein [Enterococcus sp. S86.2]|uniref:hypothetical protein n=1 Tax=Enterococcus sp. S86.2 TaxID=3031299 RepID=UPI0026F26A9B|nr:hypothetical protein [Enterococcus sp. S86.2]